MFQHSVTILEYFKNLIASQHSFHENKMRYARAYVKRVHGQDNSVKFMSFMSEEKKRTDKPAKELIREFAHKEVIYRAEKDLMQYCAEFGIEVLKAKYNDAEADMMNEWAWSKPELDRLKDVIELSIEPSTVRPLAVVGSLDFIPPGYYTSTTVTNKAATMSVIDDEEDYKAAILRQFEEEKKEAQGLYDHLDGIYD